MNRPKNLILEGVVPRLLWHFISNRYSEIVLSLSGGEFGLFFWLQRDCQKSNFQESWLEKCLATDLNLMGDELRIALGLVQLSSSHLKTEIRLYYGWVDRSRLYTSSIIRGKASNRHVNLLARPFSVIPCQWSTFQGQRTAISLIQSEKLGSSLRRLGGLTCPSSLSTCSYFHQPLILLMNRSFGCSVEW